MSMSEYICRACSNAEQGLFRFTVTWDDTTKSAFATRCPRCGALADGKDVEYL